MKTTARWLTLSLLLAAAPASAIELAAGGPAESFEVETLADGLSEPTDIAVLPDGRSVIIQRGGDITIVLPDGGQIEHHIDVHTDAGEQGLLGVVADPDFESNGYLYFYASVGDDVQNRHKVLRFVLDEDGELGKETIIVDEGLLGPANHDGGGLIIDDGYLYIGVGDTGHNATPPVNRLSTCLNSANGKILRVNLDGSIPRDNPLVGLDSVTSCRGWDQPLEEAPPDERIFAWGFRNPFRFWVDPMTGLLWVGDVGEGAREEIAVGEGGQHYGWPFFEGSIEYSQGWHPEGACMGVTPASECVPVAHEYPHENGDNCVTGGLILDVCGWPEPWRSRYIFGDHGSGRLWTLDVNDDRSGVVPGSLRLFGDEDSGGVASFRIGPDNALYIVEDKSGTVQRLTPTTTTDEDCDTPPVSGEPNGAAGSPGRPTGGTSGSNGAAPSETPSDGNDADDGGCGCRAVGSSGASAALLLAAGALGLALARRRRR